MQRRSFLASLVAIPAALKAKPAPKTTTVPVRLTDPYFYNNTIYRVDGAAYGFYVSASGHDRYGTGAQENPWKTVAHAMRQMEPGDTVRVLGGRYTG